MKEIKDANFAEETAAGLSIVDFYATWCGPCKMLSPILEELSKEITDIKFLKINIEDNNEKANEFGIRALPTLMFLKDGKEKTRSVGLMSKTDLLEWIKTNKE